MKQAALWLLLLAWQAHGLAQVKVVAVERLPLSGGKQWSHPVFAPDGRSIFYTTLDFQGIWQYWPDEKKGRLITDAPRSGFGFAISPDGRQIAFRSTRYETGSFSRTQKVILQDLTTGDTRVLASGSTLSAPVFAGPNVILSDGTTTNNLDATRNLSMPVILGIEDTKIVLIEKGKKRLLDPFKGGSYIWPAISPDGTKIAACDMTKGTFVADLDGNVLAQLGKRNGAVWTRDGRWLVYMNDKDDGHNIVSSDIYCISPDGKNVRQLTFTPDDIELYPQTSPVKNQIVFSTLDGRIGVLNYEEAGK